MGRADDRKMIAHIVLQFTTYKSFPCAHHEGGVIILDLVQVLALELKKLDPSDVGCLTSAWLASGRARTWTRSSVSAVFFTLLGLRALFLEGLFLAYQNGEFLSYQIKTTTTTTRTKNTFL